MSRGSYTIYRPQPSDSSENIWKSITCSFLIFFTIVILILLLSIPFKSNGGPIFGTGYQKGSPHNYSNSALTETFLNNSDNGSEMFAKIISTISPTRPPKTDSTNKMDEHIELSTIFSKFVETTKDDIHPIENSTKSTLIKSTTESLSKHVTKSSTIKDLFVKESRSENYMEVTSKHSDYEEIDEKTDNPMFKTSTVNLFVYKKLNVTENETDFYTSERPDEKDPEFTVTHTSKVPDEIDPAFTINHTTERPDEEDPEFTVTHTSKVPDEIDPAFTINHTSERPDEKDPEFTVKHTSKVPEEIDPAFTINHTSERPDEKDPEFTVKHTSKVPEEIDPAFTINHTSQRPDVKDPAFTINHTSQRPDDKDPAFTFNYTSKRPDEKDPEFTVKHTSKVPDEIDPAFTIIHTSQRPDEIESASTESIYHSIKYASSLASPPEKMTDSYSSSMNKSNILMSYSSNDELSTTITNSIIINTIMYLDLNTIPNNITDFTNDSDIIKSTKMTTTEKYSGKYTLNSLSKNYDDSTSKSSTIPATVNIASYYSPLTTESSKLSTTIGKINITENSTPETEIKSKIVKYLYHHMENNTSVSPVSSTDDLSTLEENNTLSSVRKDDSSESSLLVSKNNNSSRDFSISDITVEMTSPKTYSFYNASTKTSDFSSTKTTVKPISFIPLKKEKIFCHDKSSEPEVCSSNTCKIISSKMLLFMDHTIKPCDDFYNFACNGVSKEFIKQTHGFDDVSKRIKGMIQYINGSSPDYLTKFHDYYTSCMNHDILEGKKLVKNICDSAGKFFDMQSIPSGIPYLTVTLTDHLIRNFPALFDIKIETDDKRLGVTILPSFDDNTLGGLMGNQYYAEVCQEQVKKSTEKINLNDAYTKIQECQISSYFEDMKNALEFFDAFDTIDKRERDHIIKNTLILFEKNIFEVQHEAIPSITERKNILTQKNSTKMSVLALKEKFPEINWNYMFEKLLEFNLPDDVYVEIYFVDYLKKLLTSVSQLGIGEQYNCLLAMYAYKLYKDYMLDQKQRCDHSSYCIKMSTILLQDVSTAIYIDSFTSKEMKEKEKIVQDLFNQINNTFFNEIEDGNIYGNNKDKTNALSLLKELKLITVGKYTPWKDRKYLNNRFEHVAIDKYNFVYNTIELEKRHRTQMYSLYNNSPSLPENLWTLLASPFRTKPFIILPLKTMIIPLGSMSHIHEYSDAPNYIEMNKLRFHLAKEISYFLELSGVHVYHDIESFRSYSTNISSSIDNIPLSVNIDPEPSLTERISDRIGADISYISYKNTWKNEIPFIWTNMTTQQLFFLYLAQQFCTKTSVFDDQLSLFEDIKLPSMFVVNGIALNSDQLKNSFGCLQDKMPAGLPLDPSYSSVPTLDYHW